MIAFTSKILTEQSKQELCLRHGLNCAEWGKKTIFSGQPDQAAREALKALPAEIFVENDQHPAIHNLILQFAEDRSAIADPHLVAFQGARGAYSEQAIYQFFPKADVLPCSQFKDAFDAVRTRAARYAVLPIENALTGSIHDNYDLLLAYPDLAICGETRLRIRHHLYAVEGARLEDIKHVFSHPQGLLQCAAFLGKYPHWQQTPFYDTAGSVAHIKELGTKENAAIAGAAAGKVYGLPVLAESIETNHENYTRFVILARRDDELLPLDLDTRSLKVTVVFSLPHQPGALLKAMQTMGSRELNLSKIESRPIHGKPWEYMFYLDLEIGNDVDGFMRAFEELSTVGEQVRILGMYPKAR